MRRRKSTSDAYGKCIDLLKELMRRFLFDLRNGLSLLDAGWVSKHHEQCNLLHNFIEERGENIRISPKILHKLKTFHVSNDDEFSWLVGLCLDMSSMVNVRELLVEIVEKFDELPQLEGDVVAIGLGEMLKNIHTCVTLDRILEGGLNAVQWFVEAPKASIELALDIARKWWRVGLEDVDKLSRRLGLKSIGLSVNSDIVNRIRRILDWNGLLEILGKDESEALGLLWFADALLTSKGVSIPDVLPPMKDKVWKLISERTGKNEAEIMDVLEKTVDRLSENSRRFGVVTINWAGVIRPPW